jgi:hypothetical protein
MHKGCSWIISLNENNPNNPFKLQASSGEGLAGLLLLIQNALKIIQHLDANHGIKNQTYLSPYPQKTHKQNQMHDLK